MALERIDSRMIKEAMASFIEKNPGVLTIHSSSQEANRFLLQKQIDDFNNKYGKLGAPNCETCRNKGFIAVKDEDESDYHIETCPECGKQRAGFAELRKAGLSQTEGRTLDSFKTVSRTAWLMKTSAETALNEYPKYWLFFGGQSGSGKTHLCTAVTHELIKRGHSAQLVQWPTLAIQLKKLMVEDGKFPEYQRIMKLLQTTDVLYIDDFWRTEASEADRQIAMEIIDERYNSQRMTIISSELFIGEICKVDEAVGGRIFERAQKMDIARTKEENRRLHPVS